MKLLIDTQVFIWLINEDKRLGRKTLQKVKDPTNQILLSYFSVFEMTIKASVDKLDYDVSVLKDLANMGIELLFPDVDTLKDYAIFNPDNKDPFDNAIISVALYEKCALITSDPKILALNSLNLNLLNATT